MVIVLIAGFHRKMIPYISKEVSCQIIKTVGSKVFIYIDSPIDKSTMIKQLKTIINTNCGEHYFYELYPLYNGMIDLSSYLPDKVKQTSRYYNLTKKDLSDDELVTFLKKHELK